MIYKVGTDSKEKDLRPRNERVIIKELERFKIRRSGQFNSIEKLQENLNARLLSFYKVKDQLSFLRLLRERTSHKFEEHKKTCTNPNCRKDGEYDEDLYVIDQEIDKISQYYTFEPNDKQKLTPAEQVAFHKAINELKKQIDKNHKDNLSGLEVIFNELDQLKEHFNIGKKNLYDLAKGKVKRLLERKLIDSTLGDMLEKFIDGEIPQNLLE